MSNTYCVLRIAYCVKFGLCHSSVTLLVRTRLACEGFPGRPMLRCAQHDRSSLFLLLVVFCDMWLKCLMVILCAGLVARLCGISAGLWLMGRGVLTQREHYYKIHMYIERHTYIGRARAVVRRWGMHYPATFELPTTDGLTGLLTGPYFRHLVQETLLP